MDTTSVLFLFAIGAAFLAFWAVARFPSFGPQTLQSALLAVVLAFVLEAPLPDLSGSVAVSAGLAAALCFVVLPSLMVLFWTSGCLLRCLVPLLVPHRR